MKKICLITLLLSSASALTTCTVAQTLVGVSLNLGNKLTYSPNSDGLDSPIMLAGGILVNYRMNLINNWVILYGANVGIIGYSIRVHAIDTLRPQPDRGSTFSFPDYSTFYGGLALSIGKNIYLGQRELLIGLGGGVSYTYSGYSTEYSVSTHFPDGSVTEQFYATTAPRNRITSFAKVLMQFPINKLVTLGVEYSKHFSSILDGRYAFYHTKQPSSGDISLYQSEVSLVCLFKLLRK